MAGLAVVREDLFTAIAAPARRVMLRMLAHRDIPVTELAESFDMTLSAVSQHLSVLRNAGLITQHKDGRQRICQLNAQPLKEIADWVSFYEPFWTDRLHNLGNYLEDTK